MHGQTSHIGRGCTPIPPLHEPSANSESALRRWQPTSSPSGHITIPCVVLAGFLAQYPGATRWIWMVALLFPTIVTTGQHYAIDQFAGMATAFAGIALAGRPLLERRRLAPA